MQKEMHNYLFLALELGEEEWTNENSPGKLLQRETVH
jgi:hypothetical protein